MAFKEACQKADPVILEPIMKVCIIVPDEYLSLIHIWIKYMLHSSNNPRKEEQHAYF